MKCRSKAAWCAVLLAVACNSNLDRQARRHGSDAEADRLRAELEVAKAKMAQAQAEADADRARAEAERARAEAARDRAEAGALRAERESGQAAGTRPQPISREVRLKNAPFVIQARDGGVYDLTSDVNLAGRPFSFCVSWVPQGSRTDSRYIYLFDEQLNKTYERPWQYVYAARWGSHTVTVKVPGYNASCGIRSCTVEELGGRTVSGYISYGGAHPARVSVDGVLQSMDGFSGLARKE